MSVTTWLLFECENTSRWTEVKKTGNMKSKLGSNTKDGDPCHGVHCNGDHKVKLLGETTIPSIAQKFVRNFKSCLD